MWTEKLREIIRGFKEKNEWRDEVRVFDHYFPNPVRYNGILPKPGEELASDEEQLVREAGSLQAHYQTELTENGFQFKLSIDDLEVVDYLKANHKRMVGLVTYDDGKNVRFPGTRIVDVQDSTFVYTFPDIKQDITPISFYVHTPPVEGPNVPHPKFWRLGFRISSPSEGPLTK